MYKNEIEFSKIISDLFVNEGYISKTEIDSGYGIADIVCIKIKKENVNKRLNYKQITKLESENYFKVLEIIKEETTGTSLLEITSKVNISNGYLRSKILKKLVHEKFIKQDKNDTFIKINGWAPLSEEIIAIESKLNDWKRGLIQALRYKTFANQVYLAFPKEKLHLVDRTILKTLNIGLITFEKNKLEYHFKPSKQNKDIIKYKQNYVCEYFWNEIIN